MGITIDKDNLPAYIGADLGVTDWLTLDQERINAFADVTLDHQFIHVDTEAAKNTPFGSTIAHGMLVLSLLPYFFEKIGARIEGGVMGLNYGFDKVRFLTPVKVDKRVRASAKLLSVVEKNPGQFLMKQECTIEIEGEAKPALIAEWLFMAIVG